MDRAALLRTYRACHYDVRRPGTGGRDTLRIGEPVPAAIVNWLGDAPLCAFITAYNPHSAPGTAQANRRAQQELLRTLTRWRARWLPGAGRLPGQPWREPSLLAAGPDCDAIDALAWRHSQNAVVLAHGNRPVQLRLYGAAWAATDDGDPAVVVVRR